MRFTKGMARRNHRNKPERASAVYMVSDTTTTPIPRPYMTKVTTPLELLMAKRGHGDARNGPIVHPSEATA